MRVRECNTRRATKQPFAANQQFVWCFSSPREKPAVSKMNIDYMSGAPAEKGDSKKLTSKNFKKNVNFSS
jgi:hypothetical protein